MNRNSSNNAERRVAHVTDLELRKRNGKPRIRGHAAVFNSAAKLDGFSEQIAPGAFRRALAESQPTVALYNHDPNRVLGRAPRTLRMREDAIGLAVEIDPPRSESGLLELMERGDVSQMSFGFSVRDDTWRDTDTGPLRTITEVGRLFDVSVVVFPAYDATDASVAQRSLNRWRSSYPAVEAAARLREMRLELEQAYARAARLNW